MADDELIPSTAGVSLRVHRINEGRAGPVVVFAHATGMCAEVWEPMALEPPLARVGSTSFDFRSHGRSTGPDDRDLNWSGMADDVLAVVDHLGKAQRLGPVVGAGHSMGGAALLLAEQRVPGTFAALWCYEPVVFPPDFAGATATDNPLAAAARARRPGFASAAAATANYASKPPLDRWRPDALEAYVRGGFDHHDDGTVTLRCRPDDEARIFEMGPHHDAWEHLDAVRCPTWIIKGATEPGPSMMAAGVADRLPDATLVDHPDLGHFGPMQDPTAMALSLRRLVDAVDPPRS